ncbi:hypothetical protein DIS18_05535 [Algibacter marinivivus]|uniref:Choloylglycine hydrolase/NAAA C-terminal domain-containing protein n=1 Tax=Algibacter marinivivus TaxID=2100723 RepID=A0A2U2X894_9FLAO|nr:DUF2141 domain-containing protein [Algibacter marinivivus]PWH84009.1 hypothetical protein DIS18_05535 [Algibacter marinivivus]
MRAFFLTIIILFASIKASACSAFMCRAKNGVYFAKNFDWQYSHGYIIKNSKGVFKNGYNFKGEHTASWTSKYGSITFNQIGKEFPFGGMNEEGLVVEQLWNQDDCEYEVFKNSKTISELEWIQFQLDNYKTVDEVIDSLKQITIIPVMAKVHYFITDTSGKSAIIEFINGKTQLIESSDNHQLITNSNYKNSQNYWATHKDTVDKTSGRSLDRYCHLSHSISKLNLDNTIDSEALFKTLLPTRTTQTQWSIVYDVTNKEIQFLSRNNPTVKTIKLDNFNFEDDTTVAAKINSETLNFNDYSFDDNKNLVNAFQKNFGIPYIDYKMMNTHQMNPNKQLSDSLFKNTVNIKVNFNVKKNSGKIALMLVNSEKNYKKRQPIKAAKSNVVNGRVSVMFYSIPKGDYAVMAYHDVNNNEKLDTNFLGIPSEPFVFSNNAKGFMGAPKFEKAKFIVDSDTVIDLDIK